LDLELTDYQLFDAFALMTGDQVLFSFYHLAQPVEEIVQLELTF
jgi:hypothetical protein